MGKYNVGDRFIIEIKDVVGDIGYETNVGYIGKKEFDELKKFEVEAEKFYKEKLQDIYEMCKRLFLMGQEECFILFDEPYFSRILHRYSFEEIIDILHSYGDLKFEIGDVVLDRDGRKGVVVKVEDAKNSIYLLLKDGRIVWRKKIGCKKIGAHPMIKEVLDELEKED